MKHCIRRADVAHDRAIHEPWGSLTWLANDSLTESSITVGRVIIRRQMYNPRHRHPGCEEVLYLLAGRLQHTVDDQTVILNPGDTLVIPAGVVHNAASIGDVDADMIVTYSSGKRDFVPEREGDTDGEEAPAANPVKSARNSNGNHDDEVHPNESSHEHARTGAPHLAQRDGRD